MNNKDPLGFDAGLARLARYVPEAQAGGDDAQARTENKDPGNGGSPQARFLPSPREPMAVARRFLTEAATDAGTGELKLRHWRGGWWSWRTTHWREAEARHVRGLLYHFTEHALYGSGLDLKPWSPNRHKIDDVLDALSSLCFLPNYYDQPTWLDDRDSGTIVACKNGLLDVERRELMPHSPSFFNQTSVPFDYEPRARVPRAWRSFLKALWPKDPASRKTLAAWFGYVASGRLDMQKILLLIGPTPLGRASSPAFSPPSSARGTWRARPGEPCGRFRARAADRQAVGGDLGRQALRPQRLRRRRAATVDFRRGLPDGQRQVQGTVDRAAAVPPVRDQ